MAGKPSLPTKISAFYGDRLARPYVVLKEDGQVDKDRAELPRVNDALIEWASKVPFEAGGALLKPNYEGQKVEEARTDFQIFLSEKYRDILAANPGLDGADRKALLAVGSVFWRDELTPEERREYKTRAAEERAAVEARIAEAEASDPKFKAFRQQLAKYKRSVGSILSAAKAQAGPLWKLQRRANKQYRALKAEEGEEAEEEGGEEEQGEATEEKPAAKAGGKGKRGGGKAGKARKKQQQRQEEEASSEGEGESDGEEAAGAMAGLSLASAGKKKAAASRAAPPSNKKKPARAPRAGKKGYEELQGEESEGEQAQQAQQAAKKQPARAKKPASPAGEGSGAVQMVRILTRRSRGSGLYEGEYELPPSQNPTPAKAGRRGAAVAAAGAGGEEGAARLPAKSPGKRLRRGAADVVAAAAGAGEPAEVEASSAKRTRRASTRS